ncbi:M15 family metallopeptidase [Deinococcus yavapaiensis]|uniref:D-alanyl-D-alanine carboxypeptidase-like protein n=1 Tax=Deinococcus yavapaiensis KR-236 TaxID=694435 RepID=A0A318SLT0_9DEIO|nr:M15 family metallopeptidase [Deinococcus yavapaiensis]PYE53480.1 D-alanyl-D-alanine carboxypeptidase-like protein [Deinococcus yavapaiensis KR-236]
MDRLTHVLTSLAVLSTLAPPDATRADDRLARRLVAAYPSVLARVERGGFVVWRDGTRMAFDDGREPTSYLERLDHADLRDQLTTPYPACAPILPPAWNVDPGRLRHEAFFAKLYGETEAAVRANLVAVDWFGQRVSFTRVGGAAEALRRVAAEIARLPELRPFATPSAGTFVRRDVAGTNRVSMHAYAAAIDLNVKSSDYWRWTGAREGSPNVRYRNRMPLELVRIFEAHGFVWGGRWYHFDTMHFEYRPELASLGTCPS